LKWLSWGCSGSQPAAEKPVAKRVPTERPARGTSRGLRQPLGEFKVVSLDVGVEGRSPFASRTAFDGLWFVRVKGLADDGPGTGHNEPAAAKLEDVLTQDLPGLSVSDVVVQRVTGVRHLL
jgi:hypothetical protein